MTANPSLPGAGPIGVRHLTLRRGGLSARINIRAMMLIAVTLVMILASAVVAMMLGSLRIAARDVVRAVFGSGTDQQTLSSTRSASPASCSRCWSGRGSRRLERSSRGSSATRSFRPTSSGSTAERTSRSPHGSFPAWPGLVAGPGVAFLGAFASAAVIYLLSWRGGVAPNRLILVGIGIGEALSALTTLLLVSGTIEQVRPAQVWSIGSIYGADWADVRLIAVVLALLLPVAVALMWPMRILQLGEDAARSLGLGVERFRLVTLLVGCALAAICVALAGPIGFVALMFPHIARLLAGPLSGSVLVLTALIGALFLLVADMVGQHLLPVTLPVGVVRSAIGAPYFLYLLYRSNARIRNDGTGR